MVFRFYSKQISQATRGLAAVVFIVGMLLIGAAMLIFALPELFGYLMSFVFGIIGFSVLGYAVRLFVAASKMDKNAVDLANPADEIGETNETVVYRKNVNIRVSDPSEDRQE